MYPGDAYVDWTCLDGYNGGTALYHGWQSFAQVFQRSYNDVLAVAPTQPMMLGEFASTETGGSKASWITDTFSTQLPKYFPKVKAAVWFNAKHDNPYNDWRIESSSAAQSAFASAIQSSYYAQNEFGALSTSPIPPLK